MTHDWQRFVAVLALAALGGGVIYFACLAVGADGKLTTQDGGWVTAAFLSLREVFSKIENVTLGIRTPAPPTDPMGEG